MRHKLFGGTENCTVTEVSTDSLIEVLKLGHETADFTVTSEVIVKCGPLIECLFHSGTGLVGTATGPLLSSFANGDVTITSQTLSREGPICPDTAKLDFETMPLEKVYISE